MQASSKTITNIHKWRLAAITIGSAFAMALASTAFGMGGPPPDPTAVAAISPAAVWEADTVTLNATGSHTNPLGGTLLYNWQQQAPASPTITVSPDNSTLANIATFTAPMVPLAGLTQAVTFRVKVTDTDTNRNAMSSSVTTTVYASPVANAGPDAAPNENTVVMLSGSATRVQPTGTIVDYTWTAPPGITFLDTGTSTSHMQNPMFTAPFVGPAGQALTFTLVVTEHVPGLAHDQNGAADSVTINVANVNQPPTAIANTMDDSVTIVPMATVPEDTDPVTLYGFGTDPDNDLLTFNWTQVHDTSGAPLQPGDRVVTLSDNTSSSPTFAAPNLTTQSSVDLVFQLTTNDGQVSSGHSYVTIRVLNSNEPPVAVPSATPASALEGQTVTLDGTGSHDPNMSDTLTFTWAQVGAPTVALSDENAAITTFTAPAVSAMQGSITLTFNLTVSDGQAEDTQPVSVTVSHINQTPVADAGLDQPGVPELSNTCLDGSGSFDPDGDTDSLTYAWVQIDGPAVTLDNANSVGPCFDTPNVGTGGADLHFQLTVTDSHMASTTDIVLVHVNYVNQPPIANAGSDQTVDEGPSTTVHLDGSGSSDPDLNPLNYAWSQVSGPPVTIVPDPMDSSKATFLAPLVSCDGGVVVMRLTVDDTYADGMRTDDVEIHVTNVNNPPTADAGGNQSGISEGDLVELHGMGNDVDGEALLFQWTQTGGPDVGPLPSGMNVSFNAPAIPGGDPAAFVDLYFTLTVSDTCLGSTTTDAINVHVANFPHSPMAVAQANPTSANEGGDTVQLDGTMSSDPDMDPLTYTWEQTDGPSVMLVFSPGDTYHTMPMFVTPWVSANTQLKFKLTVSDWPGSSSSAYVTVTVVNWHTPPDVSHSRADVASLWPPDHKMIPVHIIGVTKPGDDKITITGVTQDEPTNGLGDGDTPIDAIMQINAPTVDDNVLLRAERSGNGNGRVYHVCFHIEDPEQDADGCVTVAVPKSKKTDVAGDGGSLYDSTH